MRIFHSSIQRGHAPAREFHNGDWANFAEKPERVDTMLEALGETEEPLDRGLEPILAIHDENYLAFLKSAYEKWAATGRAGDAMGYAFPVVRRRALSHDRIDAKLGLYGFDVATPISAGTWEATYWSAQSALAAAHAIANSVETASFALTRPPGHHAGADYCGGYCYINAVAVAAEYLREKTGKKIAILDVDYHHGNGTQDIFYERGDVFFASIHADPKTDYPFFWGHADERGADAGVGATLNIPLPRGTDWSAYEPALDSAFEAILDWGAELLVVSFGADTYIDDPISYFALTTDNMRGIGAKIASSGLPRVGIMEGGYATDVLGANVAAFIDGFEKG